jgi:hypothetical protein
MYHQIPFIGSDNSSIQNAVIFYSPERKINYGAINQASEYYSLGLIIWYVLCIKQNTLLNSDSFLDLPPYVNTGSIWDSLIEVCLNEEPKKRPKSFIALSELLPKLVVEKKSAPRKNIVLPPKPADLSSKIVNVKLYNYNYFNADILIDGVELANIKHRMEGRTLILEASNTSEIQIYNKETKLLIKSFNCSHRLEFSLPGVFDEITKSPSPPAKIFLLLIFGIVALLLLVWGHNTYFNKDNNSNGTSNIDVLEDELPTAIILNSPCKLFELPSEKSVAIQTCNIPNEEVYILYKLDANWCRIRRSNGRIGYIKNENLKIND